MLVTWTLVIYIFAGPFAETDSVSLTNVTGFNSEKSCMEAGAKAKSLATGKKDANVVCIKIY